MMDADDEPLTRELWESGRCRATVEAIAGGAIRGAEFDQFVSLLLQQQDLL